MELNPVQQAQRLISQSRKILIIAPPFDASGNPEDHLDKIVSSLALAKVLNQSNVKVAIVVPQFEQTTFAFLPDAKNIKTNLITKRSLLIYLNLPQGEQIKKISHRVIGQNLEIKVTPSRTTLTNPNIQSKAGPAPFDLIITVGLADLELLGKTFEQNSETFYETPIINLDHKATNEYFGEVNLVEVTASSAAEIVFDFLNKVNSSRLDETVATYLLAGIMAETKSFCLASTTPKTFQVAAELVALGAKKDLIVENIYKKRNFSLLKLWGRALARVQENEQYKVVGTMLTKDDCTKSKAEEKHIRSVFTEMKNMMTGVDFVILLTENQNDDIKAYIALSKNRDPRLFFGGQPNFKETSDRYETILTFPKTDLITAEQKIVSQIETALA